jgi:hypothetical protein
MPLRVSFEHVLRGISAERRDGSGEDPARRRLPLAQSQQAHVLLHQQRLRGDLSVGDILPKPYRGIDGRENRHGVSARWLYPGPDWRHHPLRGSAGIHGKLMCDLFG